MDYIGPIDGSPIFAPQLPFIYVVVFLFALVLLLYRNRKVVFAQRVRHVFLTLFIIHIWTFTVIAVTAWYLLFPLPKLSSVSYEPLPVEGPIEITFTRPFVRKMMIKSIEPEVPGMWVFTQPLYATHLYRSVVFYPTFALKPDATYKVTLSTVSNFLTLSPPATYTVKIRTQPAKLVGMKPIADQSNLILGVQDDPRSKSTEKRVSVIGSFPQDGMSDVATDQSIKVRFSENVNHQSAQEHFSLIPDVAGAFSWDGDTMVFAPSNLSFSTRYTFFVSSGVSGNASGDSTHGYAASFTTRSSVTKLDVPSYLQKYALSCEVSGLRMVLSYRGVQVTEDELLVEVGYDPTNNSGNLWGNPYVGFVGNVKGKQMVNGYGVYWEPIARAANNYRYSFSFEGWNLSQLTASIENGKPIIVWVYAKNGTPRSWSTPSGDQIYAVSGEHVVVVVGFMGPPSRPSHIIVNDPLVGQVYWERDLFEHKWNVFGRSGVLVN